MGYQIRKLKMLKVAILDDYQNVAQQFVDLEKLSGKYEFKIFSEPFIDEADAINQLADFEALLIMRERTPITKNLIDNLNDLKFVISSGLRNKSIDLEAAKKRKIIVSGTDININPTCELTWALILGLARNLKEEIDNMYQGYWQTTVGVELKGKILGLIGLGRVGSQVAKIAKVFGMEVMAWSENLSLDRCKELNVLPASKEDLIQNADFISIHVQGGERYKDCITLKELDKMKKSTFLINTSRGPIVNEDDLIIALSTNVIAGAGIDVYEKEPLPENNKLRFLPNALLTPHIGYVTAENYSIFYNQMIEGLEACVNGKPIRVLEYSLSYAHSKDYISNIKNKTLSKEEVKKIGFPLVDSVVQRSLVATGGTVLASKLAINYGIACNTAGGSHHASYDGGAGYCVFNDVAVASHYLLNRGLANKILIIDLDVHQGNGNSEIFKDNRSVFTFSMHSKTNS